MKRTAIVFLLLALLVALYFLRGEDSSISTSSTRKEANDVDRSAASVAPSPVDKPADGSPSGSVAAGSTGSLEANVLAMLRLRNGSANWKLDLDPSGRPFKIAGGTLPGLMVVGKENNDFLVDLQSALGFGTPASFDRNEKRTGNFHVVDQKQLYVLTDGQTVPVYASYIRYIGNSEGAFLIQNELRRVNSDIRLNTSITAEEAFEVAGRTRAGYEFSVRTPATVIYADKSPHQKAMQVVAKKTGDSRLLLIGEETRTVLVDVKLSLQ